MSTLARIGKYELVGELGKGAMGVVYRGYDPVIQRYVALKVIRKADLDPADGAAVLERFKREAQAVGKLHHPNIVAIYEYGEDDECAFIAMELVNGRALREHIRSGYRPELKEFPEILIHLLEGLEYSHMQGVVHRDIKPANLLISDMGVAKISDFGIARLETSHLTKMGEVLGTPFYMAPEQFSGVADERSDIYSAAVIVYEVLTGRRPFDGQGAPLMKKILEDMPPPPSSLEPRLPREIDAVLMRALAKEPAQRYRNARQFAAALLQAFENRGRISQPLPLGQGGEDTNPSDDGVADGGTISGKAAALRRALGGRLDAQGSAAGGEKAGEGAAAGSAAAPPIVPIRRPALLFVDDEERVVNALRALFKDNYRVVTATSGEQALGMVRRERFHVVVSDQRMPGMLGVDLLREVKALAPNTVRMLLTGYSDLAAIVGSVNDGEVYRFIHKPWNQDDLMSTVGEAVTIAIALEASPPPRATAKGDDDLTLVVLDDPALARATREMVGDLARVEHAANIEDALRIFAEREVAVLIADLESRRVDNTVLFKVLKREHPGTLVVVATKASDSELIISLINEARIFRFVNKPVNLTLLQSHIVAALERYHSFKQAPALMRTQRPKKPAVAESEDTTLVRSITETLRSIGSRFAAAFKS
ncbi:MAG: protein kinase [Burkholderiales bacterium]|nr:protein kinase [Burkholderiales bacterium]